MHGLMAVFSEIVDDGAPPATSHDWLIASLAGSILTFLGILVGGIFGYLKLRQVDANANAAARDAAASRQQTENEHASAEYPNMRDELTAVRELAQATRDDVADVKGDVADVRDEQREQRRDIGGVRSELRHVRDDASRLSQTVEGNAQEARRRHEHITGKLNAHLEQAAEDHAALEQLTDDVRRHHPAG